MDEVEPPGEARFDPALDAWVLTRYADVSAALRDPRLSSSGTDTGADSAHLEVRKAAAFALAPTRLAAWRAEAEGSARVLAGRLPFGVPVDLIGEFARPWSALLAARAVGIPPADAGRLDRPALEVFLAAARATDPGFPPKAIAAVAELAGQLQGTGGSADVQTYVALSQTLPRFLAGAWIELFRRPDEADRLRERPGLLPGAIEELLRLAGPSRAIFRHALAEVSIGRASIPRGSRVVLMLSSANHDPSRFPLPDRLDVRRDASGHLAFGGGPHSCPGGSLIRMAASIATGVLLDITGEVEVSGRVDWLDGFAIRAPASLSVVLRRGPSHPPPSTP